MSLFRKKTYRISPPGESWVTPEETLLDSSSQHSDVESPVSNLTFRVLAIVFVAAIAVIVLFLFSISVIDHGYFAKLALQNKSANFPLSPPRGAIFDRDGEPLAVNVPSFDILMISRELKNDGAFEARLAEISEILGLDFAVFSNEIQEKMKSNAIFFAGYDIAKEQALSLELIDLKGLYIISRTKREYPGGHKFSTVIGYTGKVQREDVEEDSYYFLTDTIGRLGLEAYYEETLRGEHGNIFFALDQEGGTNKEPRTGNSLILNLDSEMQSRLHDAMWQVLAQAGLSRGAAIIQNPENGAVLAMVSFPTYDNNIFSEALSESDVKNLFQSRDRPLFNRNISGLYNPGSTIKPYIGMTALEEGTVSPDSYIQDCVSINIGDAVFRNWRQEYGLFNMRKAIANSCNVYFYSIGGGYGNIKGLGITRIADYLKRGLADSLLEIDLPAENPGFVPTPAWKEEVKGEDWYLGDTFNVSIGQGDLIISPLWLNTYVSAIANGGTIWRPRVAESVVDEFESAIGKFEAQKIGELPFSQKVIGEMKRNMEETVISGTAKVLNSLPVTVAAKTGTAEVVKGQTINALFTAFAPADDAEIAITILIEGSAENQGYSIRVANDFLNWYFVERLRENK